MRVELAFHAGTASRERLMTIGLGYMLATGRVFTDLSEFHRFAEELLQRPVLTHEFAVEQTWVDLREAFESRALEMLS